MLILEDENDNEVFSRYDAINRVMAERVFRFGQPDSHSGDESFAPAPVSDPSNPSSTFPATIGTDRVDYEFDGLSRVTRATDNNDPGDHSDDSTVTYAYDSLGRQIEETERIGLSPIRASSSAFRAQGLRSALIYPSGSALDYTYDGLDRLQTITDADEPLPIVDYDYIGAGRILVRAYPTNGTRMTYLDDLGTVDDGYDGLRRPVRLRHLRGDNSRIVGFRHTYDRMDNKLSERKLHDPANDEIYAYDSAYRLIDFDRPNPGALASLHTDWQLDGIGNWQEVVSAESGPVATETRDHSTTNELIRRENGQTVLLSYDDNGNQTVDGPSTFQWDYRNRLRRVITTSQGSVDDVVFAYDATNRRIRMSLGESEVTEYYYDVWQVLEERDRFDVFLQRYVYGVYVDEPLILDRRPNENEMTPNAGHERLFYHQNTLHSVFAWERFPIVGGICGVLAGRHWSGKKTLGSTR